MNRIKAGYNNAGENERTIEVPLGLDFLYKYGPGIIEVGAVLPYYPEYGNFSHAVIDLFDPLGTIRKDATKYNYCGKDVLSISTIEHFGTNDYRCSQNKDSLYDFWSNLKFSRTFLLTVPLGYNKITDSFVFNELDQRIVRYIKRIDEENNWKIVNRENVLGVQYNNPYRWANGLAVITNDPIYLNEDFLMPTHKLCNNEYKRFWRIGNGKVL